MSLFKKYYAKYLIYYTIYNINCIYKQLKNPKLKNRAKAPAYSGNRC